MHVWFFRYPNLHREIFTHGRSNNNLQKVGELSWLGQNVSAFFGIRTCVGNSSLSIEATIARRKSRRIKPVRLKCIGFFGIITSSTTLHSRPKPQQPVESTGVKPFMLECIGFLENQNLRRKLLTLSQSNNNAQKVGELSRLGRYASVSSESKFAQGTLHFWLKQQQPVESRRVKLVRSECVGFTSYQNFRRELFPPGQRNNFIQKVGELKRLDQNVSGSFGIHTCVRNP